VVKFRSHNWAQDEDWKKYLNSLEIPAGNESQIMEKLKVKYYKKYFDSSFELPASYSSNASASSSSSTSSASSTSGTQNKRPDKFSQPPPSVTYLIGNYLKSHQSNVLFVAHMFLILNVFLYFIPMISYSYATYYRVVKTAIFIYGWSLISAVGIPKIEPTSVMRVVSNDNAHYLFLCLILWPAEPVSHALVVFTMYSLLQVCVWLNTNAARKLPPQFLQYYRSFLESGVQKMLQLSGQILLYCAMMEFMIMVFLIINMFFGQGSIIAILGFYWFLNLRYVYNSYSRSTLDNIGAKLDTIFHHPRCPAIITTVYNTIRTYLRNSVQRRM